MRKFRLFTPANLYTLIAILYTIRQYTLSSVFSSRIVFVLFFLLSIYYFIRVISEYGSLPVIRALTVLTALFSVYGMFLVLFPPDSAWLRECGSFQFLNDFLAALLPIFAFFYFSKKNLINEKWIFAWTFVFIFAALIQYHGMLNKRFMELAVDKTEVVNNAGYIMMSIIPCLVFSRKHKIIQYVMWGVIMVFVIFAVKRGAIILSTAAFLVFLWQTIKGEKLQHKVFISILSVIFMFFVYRYLQHLLESTNLFSSRLIATLEGNSSGRDRIYSQYLGFFINESSPLTFLFGNGPYGTLRYLGKMAHNDWLEIGIDMGLLGLTAYFYYWIKVCGMVRRSKKCCSEEVYQALFLFTILYFGKTLFSMSIMAISVYAAVPFGYCIAQYYNSIYRKASYESR